MKKIHVITTNLNVFATVSDSFSQDFKVNRSETLIEANDFIQRERCDFLFIDMVILKNAASSSSYKAVLQPFWLLYPSIEVIVMTPQNLLRDAVKAVKDGAGDYLTYPVIADEIKLVTQNITEQNIIQSELDYLRGRFWKGDSINLITTKSYKMQKVFENVRSVSPTKSTVLLTGETGTGKGVLAKLIHSHSNRKDDQFISVHCGAIPDTLIESELFGHEKGAFTGAIKRKLGKFEIAKGGTIFLDEVGTITPSAQIKLLQVLQDGIFQRLGGEDSINTDVRIIAATNINLKQLCSEGKFRSDLYYRLNVFPIELPPLIDRKEDIPTLAELFCHKLNKFHVKDIHDIHPQVIDAFLSYSWPGNIRELENIMERAYILEKSSVLMPESFPPELFSEEEILPRMKMDTSLPLSAVRRNAIEEIERCYLKESLSSNKGKINKSAEAAGITTRQLHKLMKKYNLRKEEFKI